MTAARPTTPADHIAHAKDTLTGGANPTYATAHALIAIAELLATRERKHDCICNDPIRFRELCPVPGHNA